MSRSVAAVYTDAEVSFHKGNPFIEALPPLKKKKSDYGRDLSNYPTPPNSKDRKKSEISRIQEISVLHHVVFPLPEYQELEIALTSIIRDSYVGRNPITAEDRRRRHAIAMGGEDGVTFPSNWKSTGRGYLLTGISGMGKSTYIDAALLKYDQLIEHSQYKGEALRARQIVWLKVRIPHDGTLKAFCISFCREIDKILGTDYEKRARSLGRVAAMVSYMRQVATTISLGLLIVDELQNLKQARLGVSDFMLNLFGELTEQLGTSILLIGTPAISKIFVGSVRNLRKVCDAGSKTLRRMSEKEEVWDDFCERLWNYQWVKNKVALDSVIKTAWYRHSQGVTAFAILLYGLAQRRAIGADEKLSAEVFELVAMTDMAFLQPAIRRLRSNKAEEMADYDDLIFTHEYEEAQALLGMAVYAEPQAYASGCEEFEDFAESPAEKSSKPKRSKISEKSLPRPDIPIEDPFSNS